MLNNVTRYIINYKGLQWFENDKHMQCFIKHVNSRTATNKNVVDTFRDALEAATAKRLFKKYFGTGNGLLILRPTCSELCNLSSRTMSKGLWLM